MPSSRKRRARLAAALVAAASFAPRAEAQEAAQGFAVERFYPAAPGGGWMVMDDLAMRGGLGGVVAIRGGYAHDPLRVTDGAQRASVVADQAFAGVGLAVTYARLRLYLDLDSPIAVKGDSAVLGSYALTAPSVSLASHPDTFADARLGLDARVVGEATSPFRLGAGAQVLFPSGSRTDYVTDGTFRAMGRVLFAGDIGRLTYAGQLGVHVRPRDDSPSPGGPRGSELLFGIAAGPRFAVGASGASFVVGPEIYGQSALGALFGSTSTGLEGLVTGRLEGPTDGGPGLRVKLGAGGGLDAHFGAPAWRLVFAIEVSDRVDRVESPTSPP